MYDLYRIQFAATERLRRLAAAVSRRLSGPDRGDNPIPTAVIIVGMVLIAGVVIVALGTLVRNYLAQAPANVPQP